MPDRPSYIEYVRDEEHMQAFRLYQSRYAGRMRESDGVLIDLVRGRVRSKDGSGQTLLDVGCSSGNLLLHLHHAFRELGLHGADLAGTILEQNRKDPELSGIEFIEVDMLAFPEKRQFDFVVVNASLPFFEQPDFFRAIANMARAVKSGGTFIAFDWFHPFEQEITIKETSVLHPLGLTFHFRSQKSTRAAVAEAGLTNPEFRRFHMPFDLPLSDDPADVNSYTVQTQTGERLSFRGALCQPWCHLIASKP